MMIRRTESIAISVARPESAVIERAAALLLQGGLIVAPTETRYGLLTRTDTESALGRLFAVKQRARKDPVALFLRDYGSFAAFASTNGMADRLASTFLPGPLTLVLKSEGSLSESVAIDGKVGLRYSSSPVIAAILERVRLPLTATSANISGEAESSELATIVEALGDEVDLYLDGGSLTGPVSTVVDCTGEAVKIIREGAISIEKIQRALDGVRKT